MGNSPLGHEESDMIEQWSTGAHVHTHTHTHSVESEVQYLKEANYFTMLYWFCHTFLKVGNKVGCDMKGLPW